jgi:glycosyltransferase involved in cell wall biosynthesis
MPKEGIQHAKTRTVLFVTNTVGYGGSEKHLLEIISRLGDSNVRSVILCAKTDPFSARLKNHYPNVAIRCEPALKSPWGWFRVFRDVKPDVLALIYGTLLDIPWYVSVAARLARVPRLYAIQHLIPPPPPAKVEVKSIRDVVSRLIGKRVRYMLGSRVPPHLCDNTICVSNAVRDALIRDYHFPSRKMVTIRNGVSLSAFEVSGSEGIAVRSDLGIHSDEFVLVCAARLSGEKGIDILILAMSELLRRNISCKCIVVGEGNRKEKLSAQILQLGLASHVFMVGFQSDVRPYLHAANAFVLTSYKEGLPFAVLEAMACGLPCVVTNVGGNAEAVAHNETGLIVKPGSPSEVAEAVSYLVTHPEERARMSRAARLRVREEFDVEARMAEIKRAILN